MFGKKKVDWIEEFLLSARELAERLCDAQEVIEQKDKQNAKLVYELDELREKDCLREQSKKAPHLFIIHGSGRFCQVYAHEGRRHRDDSAHFHVYQEDGTKKLVLRIKGDVQSIEEHCNRTEDKEKEG